MGERYGSHTEPVGEHLRNTLFRGLRQGNLGILEDLHDLHTIVAQLDIGYFALHQAASALHDEAFVEATRSRLEGLATESEWLNRQIRQIAAQALVVPTLP